MDLTNTYLAYKLAKLLSMPFSEWDAFKLGIIDDKGEVLKKPESRVEKDAFSSFIRIVRNIKRAITKLTGHSRAAAILSTMVLLKAEYQLPLFGYILKEEVIMPAELVASLSKKAGINIEKGEKLWDKAKDVVKNQYPDVEDKSERYYKLVVGVFKKAIGLKEETVSGDVAYPDDVFRFTNTSSDRHYSDGIRYPDGDIKGVPYFNVDFDDITISNILDGKKKYKRWKDFVKDRGIHIWANKNFKPFSIRTKNGIFFQLR